MESLESALPEGVVKSVSLVCKETGLTRPEVIHSPGVKYRGANDTVCMGENPHKGFREVKAP